MTDNTPGWQPDPNGKHDHRYWDGSQWTDNVADAGVAGTDPYDAELGAAGDATVVDTPVTPTPLPPPLAAGTTAEWPTAPGAPAPPPPYVPTAPVSGGGSKKGLLVGGGILAAIAIAVGAVMALGGGDDGDDKLRTELVAKFRQEGDLSRSDAECLADFYLDDLGADAFKGIDLSDPDSDPPKALEDEFQATGIKAVRECDIAGLVPEESSSTTDTTDGSSDDGDGTYGSDPVLDALYDDCAGGDYAACDELYDKSPLGSDYEAFADSCGERNDPQGYCVDVYGDGDGSTTTTSDGAGTDSSLPVDFEKILADTYQEMFDLSRDKAECLAQSLGAAIEDGSITEEQAFSEIMSYLSYCDISLEEISGN